MNWYLEFEDLSDSVDVPCRHFYPAFQSQIPEATSILAETIETWLSSPELKRASGWRMINPVFIPEWWDRCVR